MPCFSELFCERHGIDPNRYVDSMFWRCLHPRALLFALFVRLFARDYFQPDYEFIRSVGRLNSASELPDELANYNFHPQNRGWLRRKLKLRVSGRRLYHIVTHTLPDSLAAENPIVDSATPFVGDGDSRSSHAG